ncbi:cytochrome P450 [Streptomyces sodiiphilus]|uniref:Cytochrome P450 n=1 Tax=Streptomyces sodiiphilus TaxID=226217 RepID=A0ABN2PT87_9ACTN
MPLLRTPSAPPSALPRASARDEMRIAGQLILPKILEGVIVRHRFGMAPSERFQWDRRGIDLVREMRERYGPGPLHLRAGGRSMALLLEQEDVARVLDGTPEPFTPATAEKRGALAKFQPHGSLITRGEKREQRRRFNEDALEMDKPLHHLAPAVVRVVREEAARLAEDAAAAGGVLDWDTFHQAWWRGVRRIVLGDDAAKDTGLTRGLDRLRAAANLSVFAPRRKRLRAEFLVQLQRYAFSAGPQTLAGSLQQMHTDPDTDPVGQIPHWLFAFDAEAIVTLRALALLAGHPAEAGRAREETGGADLDEPRELPFLRGTVLESVRLWPTTPMVLRESTEDTRWRGTVIPAGTGFAVYAPWFHRAEPAGAVADRFVPDIWLDGRARENRGFVPFSGGPGRCPGENLVLFTAATWLASLLDHRDFEPASTPRPEAGTPLPKTLNHFTLRCTVRDPARGS